MHTSACFKIVNKCKISKFARFKFKDFSRISSTFKHLICFQALSRALKLLLQIQAFSRISQACYEPCEKICLYLRIGNGQPRESALCRLYRHTFVPYSNKLNTVIRLRPCSTAAPWWARLSICSDAESMLPPLEIL